MSRAAAGWLPRGRPAGRFPLFLLPPAGGSATLFRSWCDAFPADVAVCPVELPGRGRRITEPRWTDVDGVVGELDAACGPVAGDRWAVFGHSMGGLLAAAWAARAHRAGRGPAVLLVSAVAPPWLVSAEPLAALDDESLWRYMTRLQGVSDGPLVGPVARRLLGPVLRADIRAAAAHRPPGPRPAGCPVVVLAGRDDPVVPTATLADWTRVGDGEFCLRILPGGHFYRGGLDDLIPVIGAELVARWQIEPPAGTGAGSTEVDGHERKELS